MYLFGSFLTLTPALFREKVRKSGEKAVRDLSAVLIDPRKLVTPQKAMLRRPLKRSLKQGRLFLRKL